MSSEATLASENRSATFDSSLLGTDLCSAALAPTDPSLRTWKTRDFLILWISLAACIPTYQLASGLIRQGMNWNQALGTILLGNLIILVPLLLNAHVGTKYGIPFPVYCRASFGVLGANVPALLRALVGCGWFGIQSWIGGWAIYKILAVFVPSLDSQPSIAFLGINSAQVICLLAFWLLNMAIISMGIDSIRVLLAIKAPLLVILGLLFVGWAVVAANGLGPLFSASSNSEVNKEAFRSLFWPSLTANVGFWATLALNIPDFSRYARSQRDQIVGQCIGLPIGMLLFSFIGIAVTSATIVIHGKAIWDPVVVLSKFNNPLVLVLALLALVIATLATNIAANLVSPANDFVQLLPSKISFRTGGWITGVLGLLIQPWNLVSEPQGYFFTWLIAYASLLGAVGGILVADYYCIRRTVLNLNDLYRAGGDYWYWHGFNPWAMIALVAGILPCIPGFAEELNRAVWPTTFWNSIYHYSWFVSFGIAFAVYLLGTKYCRPTR